MAYKHLTVNEVIDALIELKNQGKGDYIVTKDMTPWSGGFAVKEVRVNDEYKLASF